MWTPSPVTRFKDSGKVLKAIQGILELHEESVIQATANPSGATAGQVSTNTVNSISEVLRNAATSSQIFKSRSEA